MYKEKFSPATNLRYNSGFYEANLSALAEKAPPPARISSPFENSGREKAPQTAAKKGPEATHPGLIHKGKHFSLGRIHIRTERKRPWRIQISRKIVRLATERNRWRRRIREVLRLKRASPGQGSLGVVKLLAAGKIRAAEFNQELTELLEQGRFL